MDIRLIFLNRLYDRDGVTKEARLVLLMDLGFRYQVLYAGKSTYYKDKISAKAARRQTFKKSF